MFSFLVGNEDLHLKNFSIQTRKDGVRQLTPAYDLVNTTIDMANPIEEMALELHDKRKGFTRSDFVDYFAQEHCYVKKEKAEKIVQDLLSLIPLFVVLIDKSFLSEKMERKYKEVIENRSQRLSSN